MLHLKFALNLENLADELIKTLKKAWTGPFQSPIVIFPDPKLEQWFRLYWVKKCGTLSNFNSMMIDRFLMKILCADDNTQKKLNADLLRNVIWAYLYKQDESGSPNYRILGDEVIRYLEINGKLDEQNLFDMCGKIAALFLEYETSRPAGFFRKGGNLSADGTLAEGVLDRWKQGALRDFFDGSEREKWQRTLYSKIFHEQDGKPSLLTRVFNAANERKNKDKAIPFNTTYLTIPFLFKSCMESNSGNFHCEQFMGENGKALPVFIFGLTGMGQFYRVILQKFAEQHEVFAYIQNPCMEFWEDSTTKKEMRHKKWVSRQGNWEGTSGPIPSEVRNRLDARLDESAEPGDNDDTEQGVNTKNENTLLCYWGKSGRDNIKLWCQAADYDFEFDDETVATEVRADDSLLHKMQFMIANRKNELDDISEFTDAANNDESFTLTAAPTKEREIEAIHTRICNLLAERDSNGNPVNRFSDILVLSPNLDDYRTAIFQAFDQSSNSSDSASESLKIPFSIVDSPAKDSLTADALDALFAILENGSITRPTFFSLIRNPVVLLTRNISEDDIVAWETWIDCTNTFRTRNGIDDWSQSVHRLLAAKFSDHTLDANSNSFESANGYRLVAPYTDIYSNNTASISRFAKCIEDLEDWIKLAKNNTTVSDETLDVVATHLNNWIAIKKQPENYAREIIIFQNVSEALENMRVQYDAGAKTISWFCISQTLREAAQSSAYSCGTIFINGITFSKFVPNRIIPVKHLFFLGADSRSFPGRKKDNALDLRKTCAPWPGDDSPVAKSRYAFLCQLMCTKESFHISYVNKNIIKDEDLYPSSVIYDIRNFFKNAIFLTAKSNGKTMTTSEAKAIAEKLWPQINIPLDENRPYKDLFTAKEFRNKAVYNGMIKSKSALEKTLNLPKKMDKFPDRVSISQLAKFLKDPFIFHSENIIKSDDDFTDLADTIFEPIDFDYLEQSSLLKTVLAASIFNQENILNDLKKDFDLKKKLPDKPFDIKIWESAKSKSDAIREQMKKIPDSPEHSPHNWKYGEKFEMLVEGKKNSFWTLQGKLNWCNLSHDDICTITSTSPTGKTGNKRFNNSKYVTQYITALALIAQKNSISPKSVKISIYSVNGNEPCVAKVRMNSIQASNMLNAIYRKAFERKYSKAIPIDLTDQEFESFSDFTDELSSDSNYSDKSHLFNKQTDLGFTNDNFGGKHGEWAKESACQKKLFKITIGIDEKKLEGDA